MLETLNNYYANAKVIMQAVVAVAALIAAMRIYQQMQRGEDVQDDMIRWLVNICVAYLFLLGVEYFLGGTNSIDNNGGTPITGLPWDPLNTAMFWARETHQAAIVFGIIYAIVGIIRVYNKFQNGDERIYEFMLLWFGSLIFLFSIGWIINTTFEY